MMSKTSSGIVSREFARPEIYHTFTPNENLMDLMLLTDNNNLKARPIPFDVMFMPLRYIYNGVVFNGMFAYCMKTSLDEYLHYRHNQQGLVPITSGWVISLMTLIDETYLHYGVPKTKSWMYPQVFDEDGRRIADSDSDMRPHGIGVRDWREATKAFANLFFNLVDFLNHPDVEYRVHHHDEKEQDKRERRGKPRLSPNVLIRVTGKTARYLDAVRSIGKREFSHAFWVRGHYRHLESDFYKDMKGKTIWVPPFIKGDKELIEKVYEMKWPH